MLVIPKADVSGDPPAMVGPLIKRTIFKTITFRVIVTSLDFASNYTAIGELTAAAGLSAYGLVAGPLFYFAHEMLWDRFGSGVTAVGVWPRARTHADLVGARGLTVSSTLAKTITYRAFATTTDFAANYVAVRDLATAAGLTAFGFVVGPFVYYGHEKAWTYFDPPVFVARSSHSCPTTRS